MPLTHPIRAFPSASALKLAIDRYSTTSTRGSASSRLNSTPIGGKPRGRKIRCSHRCGFAYLAASWRFRCYRRIANVAQDDRFLEMNPAFRRHTAGLENAQGHSVQDSLPEHEQRWFDIYGRVAATGEPARFESGSQPLKDRWFDVQSFGSASRTPIRSLFCSTTQLSVAGRPPA
jgi:hypothetical protein